MFISVQFETMVSQKAIIFVLLLFVSLVYGSVAQNPSYQNYLYKRPNSGVIDDSTFPYSENQSGHNYQQIYTRQPLYSGNNHHSSLGHGNGGINRGIPIGAYPPPNHMLHGQNGFGFGGFTNNPYQQFPNPYSPYQMHSQLMPYTANFLNSLRTGINAGIPAYGFGYGIIGVPNNSLLGSSNSGYLSGPYRTSSANSATNNNSNDNNISSARSYLQQKNQSLETILSKNLKNQYFHELHAIRSL